VKKYLAEFIGTFALVFCGTGAIIINQETGGQVSNLGIAITFGLIITVMVYCFANTSGAHFNPAVTLGFSLSGLFERKEILPYLVSQATGALLATGILKYLFPGNNDLGATLPANDSMQSFLLEIVITFFLMLVILSTSQAEKEVRQFAGIAIGATVMLAAIFAGPICGASMNPARSFSPAVVSGNFTCLWIYLTAPLAGAGMATLAWNVLKS
jgi:aquaporin Z